MGTATWSVITNPPAAGFGTVTCLRVILAVASSTIREGERLHFTLKFLRHRRRDTPRSGIMIKWMLKRRPGIVAKQSRRETNNCAYENRPDTSTVGNV